MQTRYYKTGILHEPFVVFFCREPHREAGEPGKGRPQGRLHPRVCAEDAAQVEAAKTGWQQRQRACRFGISDFGPGGV